MTRAVGESRRGEPLHVLFICPRFPDSLWNFEGIHALAGVRAAQSPLGLATLAALTPAEMTVSLVDENVEPIDFDQPCDVVAISSFNVQWARAVEIAGEFRRRGRLVAIGGPYPTLCPERFENAADVLFIGEAEYTWPRFCRQLLAGQVPPPVFEQEHGRVLLTDSPIPRYDLLAGGRYLYHYVQTTRGCPFQCEFCDIIVTDGRRPRTKTVAQVLAEIEAIDRVGGRYIAFSDANLLAKPRFAEELLEALREFGERRGYPIRFSGEMTLNVVEHPRILQLMRDSNFESIFIGIESPRAASLAETKKTQNVRSSMIEDIQTVQSHNIMVIAGMIVGFDHDDAGIFQETFDFLQEAGIPFTTAGVLFAIEHTPLHARLEREGRLLDYDPTSVRVHGSADLNFHPKQMTREQLRQGYNWLIRALYGYDHYGDRLVRVMRRFSKPSRSGRVAGRRLTRTQAAIAGRVLVHFLFTRDRARRRFFLRTLWQVMRNKPSLQKLVVALSFMTIHKHLHEYVERVHGGVEAEGTVSPFAARAGTERATRSKRMSSGAVGAATA
jgi:radical SAM superfamily enzyme YgiQ (UPF0313 family)